MICPCPYPPTEFALAQRMIMYDCYTVCHRIDARIGIGIGIDIRLHICIRTRMHMVRGAELVQ